MADADKDRVVTSVQTALDVPTERVIEDRFTDLDGGGGGVDGGGAGGESAIPSALPPLVDPNFNKVGAKHPLRKPFDAIVASSNYKHLCFAIADLTANAQKPDYVGYRDDDQIFVASIAKLAMLAPAFQLRESAIAAAPGLAAKKKAADLFAHLARSWASEFRRGDLPKANNTRPDLAHILLARRASQKDPFKISFAKATSTDPSDKFKEWLTAALKESKNVEASKCIRLLGFPFIRAANEAAGILNPKTSRGLWLSGDFQGRLWDPGLSRQHAGGTARSIATLLTLMAQDRLIKPGLSGEMFRMLSTGTPPGTDSPIRIGTLARMPQNEKLDYSIASKLGATDNFNGDCGLVERITSSGKALSYVLVVLGGKDSSDVEAAAADLDDCVLLAHGEPKKP